MDALKVRLTQHAMGAQEGVAPSFTFRFCSDCERCIMSDHRVHPSYVLAYKDTRKGCVEVVGSFKSFSCSIQCDLRHPPSIGRTLRITIKSSTCPEIKVVGYEVVIFTKGLAPEYDACYFALDKESMNAIIEELIKQNIFEYENSVYGFDWCDGIWQ